MSEQKTNRKPIIVLAVLLSLAVIAISVLTITYINTNKQLTQTNDDLLAMTALQETTATTLTSTEGTLAETQTALADMTTLQETTAATLATTESTLAETQTALADMTTLQETTAATLATTEGTLAETQTALADMTSLQEETAASLATTEAELAKAQEELRTAKVTGDANINGSAIEDATDQLPTAFTAGYEKAEFKKFNSYASENGLGGSRIYFQGTLEKTELLDTDGSTMILGYVSDDAGNTWLIHLHIYPIVSKTSFDSYIGKKIAIRGVYGGYSGVKKMPAVTLDEMIVLETGENVVGMQKLLD